MAWSYKDFEEVVGKKVVSIRNPRWGFAYSSQAPYDGKPHLVIDYHQLEYDDKEKTFYAMLELEGIDGMYSSRDFRVL